MPKLILSAVGQSVIVDQKSNQVSIINILQELASPSFPTGVQFLDYVCMFIREEGDQDKVDGVVFKVLNNESQILTVDVDVDFKGKNRTRAIVKINGLPIEKPGNLFFQLQRGEQIIANYEVPVLLKSETSVGE